MGDGLRVTIEPTNGRSPRRVVRLEMGDREHVDTIDPLSGFERGKLVERAAGRFGVGRDRLEGLDAAIVQAAGESDTKHDAREPVRFPRINCAELDAADYPVDYLIERTLVAGQPCILAGGKKSLKTSLIIDMGISLAMGGHFLGKLPVSRACRVGIMTGESGMGTIQETARRVARAAGHRLGDVGGLVFSDMLPQFADLNHLDALRAFITDDAIEVLFVDPAYLCMDGDGAENLFKQGKILAAVNHVCADTGCTFVLAHHTKRGGKADPFAPPELEDIAWAGFQEWARQWILVGRRERYEPGSGEHRLWLNVGGSAGHSALWAVDVSEGAYDGQTARRWDVTVQHAEEARSETSERIEAAKAKLKAERDRAKLEADRKAIVSAMIVLKGAESRNGVRERVSIGHAAFDRAWPSLVSDGTIREAGTTKRGTVMAMLFELTPQEVT
jgi:replicative DNA helicase